MARTAAQKARHAEAMRWYRQRDREWLFHWAMGDPIWVEVRDCLLLLTAFGVVLIGSGSGKP